MPRENLQVHPIEELTVEEINIMTTGINQRFDQVMEILEEHEGLNGKKMTQSNEIDMNGNDIIGIKELKFKLERLPKRVAVGIQDLLTQVSEDITDPLAAPGTATILRDDIVANMIPHIEEIFEKLRTILNEMINEIEEKG